MKKRFFYILCLGLVLLSSCQGAPQQSLPSATPEATAQPTPTPLPLPSATPTDAPALPLTITIDPDTQYQTLEEVSGGNFIHQSNKITTATDSIADYNLKALNNPYAIRVDLDLEEWEPFPNKTGDKRFKDSGYVNATFLFMQQVEKTRPSTLIVASMWQIPDWMASSTVYRNRRVDPAHYADLADSIGQWLLHAKKQYGVEVDYVSFNEANGGINVLLTPEEYIPIIRASGERFKELGLTTRWLIGDASNVQEALDYGKAIWQAEEIRPYLGPFAFHTWPPDPPDAMKRIGDFARTNNLAVWATETGWDQYQGARSFEFSTWKHAINLADVYIRAMRDGHVSFLLYWSMMGPDFNINDGKKAFPALLYLQALQGRFSMGTLVVKVSADPIQGASTPAVAGYLMGGGFTVQVVNRANTDRQVTFVGLPDGTYEVLLLSEATGVKEQAPVEVTGGTLEVTLPTGSITFFTKYSAPQ